MPWHVHCSPLMAMAQTTGKPSEIELLKMEMETLGEQLEQERLDRKTEVNLLKLEMEALRQSLQKFAPEFDRYYHDVREDLNQHFDPEVSKRVS